MDIQKQSEHLLEHMQILKLKIMIRLLPCIWLLLNGHTEVVSALIGARANIEAQDNDQITPLHYAAVNGHTEAIRVLILKLMQISKLKTLISDSITFGC